MTDNLRCRDGRRAAYHVAMPAPQHRRRRHRRHRRVAGSARASTSLVAALAGLAAAALVLAGLVAGTLPAPAAPGVAKAETVIASRTLGKSVQGRAIRAFRLGEPRAGIRAVVLGSMHGDEKAGLAVVDSLRKGRPVHDIDLWVVPTINPDGVAANRRQNARGVDLNRNFPHRWARLSGKYYSGTGPLSEPETRAFARFLDQVKPHFVVSFHQPLYGVGASDKGKPLQRRLARSLGLPIRAFNCTGVCHGSMTSWFNTKHRGAAITVEFGPSPGQAYLRGRAARGTLAAVLGSRF